jgi:hypothetical protein
MDWSFPTEVPASTSPLSHYEPKPFSSDEELTLIQAQRDLDNRVSTLSLIDLDASLPGDFGETIRPSTANSDALSSASEMLHTPFELERHTFEPVSRPLNAREPSIYFDGGDFNVDEALDIADEPNQTMLHSNQQTSQQDLPNAYGGDGDVSRLAGHDFNTRTSGIPMISLPPLPKPPTTEVMQGTGTEEDVKYDLLRLVSSLKSHLDLGNQVLETLPIRKGHVYLGTAAARCSRPTIYSGTPYCLSPD